MSIKEAGCPTPLRSEESRLTTWGEGGEGRWGEWEGALLTGPTARTEGTKGLTWALRTTNWEVGGPGRLPGQSAAPPAPLHAARDASAPPANHMESKGRKWLGRPSWLPEMGPTAMCPHTGEPGHNRSRGPGRGGAPGDMRGPGRLRQQLQKHTVIFLLTLSLSHPPLLKTPQGHLVLRGCAGPTAGPFLTLHSSVPLALALWLCLQLYASL